MLTYLHPGPARLAPIGFAAALALAAGCDAPVAPEIASTPGPVAHAHLGEDDGAVATPFRARLFTLLGGLTPDPRCGDPPRLFNTQVGEGEATHLGRFSVVITFCMDVTAVLDDGQITEGESLPYDNGFGILTAANGDELYMEISGVVVPSSHPDYDLEFHDLFRFTGGTGRLAGAAGEGRTDSFVDRAANRTDHMWQGTLVLPTGQ